MMDDRLESKLRQAGGTEVALPANRDAIRNLVARAARQSRRGRRPALKPFFAAGVTVGVVIGAVFVLLMKDADARPEPVVNLGGAWHTYTDDRNEGAVVWPPASFEGRNNFVKSAPGFGGAGYAVRFRGAVDASNGPGFIGVSTFLSPQCMDEACAGVDLRKYEGIRFKMRGRVQGGPLLLVITGSDSVAVKKGDVPTSMPFEYEADITRFTSEEWRTVNLDLRDDFARSGVTRPSSTDIEAVLSDTRQVKWHVRGEKHADADVWIDNLEFY